MLTGSITSHTCSTPSGPDHPHLWQDFLGSMTPATFAFIGCLETFRRPRTGLCATHAHPYSLDGWSQSRLSRIPIRPADRAVSLRSRRTTRGHHLDGPGRT